MEIILLGTGTGAPNLDRGASGLVFKLNKKVILFDGGADIVRRLLKAGIYHKTVNQIIYSHYHPDHVAGLVPILFANNYHISPRKEELSIFGAKGLRQHYSGLINVYGDWLKPKEYKLHLNEYKNSPYEDSEYTLHYMPLFHVNSSLGYRLVTKNGKVIVYSGDTGYCKNIVTISSQADILISECSLSEAHYMDRHLTPRLAGRIAREAQVKHLVLTHMYPVFSGIDIRAECRKEFSGRITIAQDFQRITIC